MVGGWLMVGWWVVNGWLVGWPLISHTRPIKSLFSGGALVYNIPFTFSTLLIVKDMCI